MDVNNENIQIKCFLKRDHVCTQINWGSFNHQPTVYVGTVYFMEAWNGVELWSGTENYIKTNPVRIKKSPDGHTMGNDALTNGLMSSRSPPNLKFFIIVVHRVLKSARYDAYIKSS